MSIDPSVPNLSADPGEISPAVPASVVLGLAQATARSALEREPPVGITREARRRIGRNLRLLYDEVLNQPLPDRFDALLADLAARTETGGPA